MPVQHYEIDATNKRDDRLIGYSIDVEVPPNFEPDVPRLCDWVQNVALGIMDDGWTHNDLLDESVHVRIVNRDQVLLVDTIKLRDRIDSE